MSGDNLNRLWIGDNLNKVIGLYDEHTVDYIEALVKGSSSLEKIKSGLMDIEFQEPQADKFIELISGSFKSQQRAVQNVRL